MNNQPRGSFRSDQVEQLLKPVEPWRVVTGSHVQPHLSQQDVLAHLNRMFGFGNFDVEVITAEPIFEEQVTNSKGNPAWSVGYRAIVRLTIRDARGEMVAHYDGGSTGESEGQPSRAASHDLAFKSALSTATKRAAIHLGDQFGLSLYNKGQREALVMGTLVGSSWRSDMLDSGPQQEVDGGAVAERQDEAAEAPQAAPEPTALPTATKRATVGKQGTRRRKAADKPADEAQAAPEQPAEDVVDAEVVDDAEAQLARDGYVEPETLDAIASERAEREAMAAEQTRQVTEREAIIATAEQVDRDDEEAVKAWNAEHGKATGHYLTSTAELARRREQTAAPEAEQDAPVFVDEQTGDVYDSQADLDAAIKARVQAKQAERDEQPQQVAVEISGEYDVATAEEPTNYMRRAMAATTVEQTRQVWIDAQADTANPMTTELRMAIVNRKAEIEAAG